MSSTNGSSVNINLRQSDDGWEWKITSEQDRIGSQHVASGVAKSVSEALLTAAGHTVASLERDSQRQAKMAKVGKIERSFER